jgi:mRNA interferase MazF
LVKDWVPNAGDIIWVDLNPTVGHEQAGRRPALVLSRSDYNDRSGLCLVCPLTNEAKGYPFEVPMPDNGVVLVDHVKSIDWRFRKTQAKGIAPTEVLAKVRVLLGTLLQLT